MTEKSENVIGPYGYSGSFGCNQVLIEGGPGQGKTLFMRKLCLSEIKAKRYIPVFFELRDMDCKSTLKKSLIGLLNEYGLPVTNEIFDFLVTTDKMLFLLDGFDELPPTSRPKVAKELEKLVHKFPNLRIIMSSRPDAGMGGSIYFRSFKLAPLNPKRQDEFVDHIMKGDGSDIIKALSASKYIRDVTTSPLLLALFTVTYKARQFRPDDLAQFYSIIFPTMLYRHDRRKLGYERQRRSMLGDFQFEKVFEVICFLSLKKNMTRFNTKDFKLFASKALHSEDIDQDRVDALIEDINLITSLIIKDGYDHYAFSHKTIQEYFSAEYLRRSEQNIRKSFYSHLVGNYKAVQVWQSTLNFLSIIDRKNYLMEFVVPSRKSLAKLDVHGNPKLTFNYLETLYSKVSKVMVREDGTIEDVFWGDSFASAIARPFINTVRGAIKGFLKSKSNEVAHYISFLDVKAYESACTEDGFVINLSKLISELHMKKELVSFVSDSLVGSMFMQRTVEMEDTLKEIENITLEMADFG
nr:NACHT domain-containing protein [Mariprofundus sp. KV]